MVLDRKSKQADRIANLYRAALNLAKNKVETGLFFLKKSGVKQDISGLDDENKRLLLAEKILDHYHRLRFQR